MRIGFIQFSPRFANKRANLETIEKMASGLKTDLLVLPEMCTTGYMVRNKAELSALAESLDGPTARALTAIAKTNDTCLIAGLPEKVGNKIFSTAAAIGPRGLIAKHQKSHLFLKEKIYFAPGETAPSIFAWRGAKIGLGVCYDYMFPEFWRKLALGGADLFCNSANFVYDYGFRLMRARSLENGVFSITVNRSGQERGQSFKGGSEIINNRGGLIKKAGLRPECYAVEIDLKKARDKKWNEYNDLFTDRREELYRR